MIVTFISHYFNQRDRQTETERTTETEPGGGGGGGVVVEKGERRVKDKERRWGEGELKAKSGES